jgi:hypothetical protein
MRNIIKYLFAALVCASIAAHGQTDEPKKCATFDRYRTGLPPAISGKIMLTRPVLQTSILSPLKRFRIHFDTTGINTPAMVTPQGARIEGTAAQYADTAAKIFDSVWTAEVTTFGFGAPPSDQGEGGGNEYDIYIEARPTNDFGETVWDDSAPLPGQSSPPRFTSYISIDNDFGAGYRTIGMHALMSTAAHEFHHAIQIGVYGVWYTDFYFYELSAESMEPTVFPSSKDYVQDIRTYFGNIENISLYTPNSLYRGYERAIWGIFLMKRYSTAVMREIWEAIASGRPVPAMETALEKRGTSLPKEFSEFCYWNYFTGPRADTVLYYADSKLFPNVNVRDKQTLGTAPVVFQYACKGFGVNYLDVQRATDTASFIIANTNMDDALGLQTNSYGYQLNVSGAAIDGGARLTNGMYANFSVSDPSNWKFLSLVQSVPGQQNVIACFPNPFAPSASSLFIGMNTAQAQQGTQTLTVISSGYERVFSGSVPRQTFNGALYAVWDGKSQSGEYIASGIYMYVLTAGSESTKGKFAVIR